VTPAPAVQVTPEAAVWPVLPTVQVTVAAAVDGEEVEHAVNVSVGVVLTVIEYAYVPAVPAGAGVAVSVPA
jgi:hypothetical protein